MRVGPAVVAALGSGPVSAVARRFNRSRLRVLAYHDVPDVAAFTAQLDRVLRRYHPVSGAQVAEAIRLGRDLPPDAVWLTFDDGHGDVVTNGLPLLRARGIPATLFVCPGVVVADRRPWWDLVVAAERAGWRPTHDLGPNVARALKDVPDPVRRRTVDAAREWLRSTGLLEETVARGADEALLGAWLDAGMELGNHTWDHPCLDHCTVEEQAGQIERADAWLASFGAFERVRLFAYPNGDETAASAEVARRLGYEVAVLFDHRLTDVRVADPMRLSRLRIDATADVRRTRSIVSGAHAVAFRRGR